MKVLTLSGWGQPFDALSHIAPGSTAVDYAHAANASEALRMIAAQGGDAELVIGWSLGGQLAVRAVAEGLIAPRWLVLIAAPFQFVGGSAMGPETFAKFTASYKANPKRTLHKAWELVHYEDERSDYIRDQLAALSMDAVFSRDWLRWLGILEQYDCDALDFSRFPKTLLVHGDRDKVVGAEQSERFASRLPEAQLALWPGCGHAPHWHDAPRLKALIAEHAHV